MGSTGIITLLIIIVTCITSITAFSNRELFGKMLFAPYLISSRKQWYRFASHALVHGDWVHLIFNMLALYMFGSVVEQDIFPVLFNEKAMFYYVLLYLGGTVFSSLYSYSKHKHNAYYSAVGASGAVSAVMMPFVLAAPWAPLYMFFIPIQIPAFIFAIVYMIFSWYMGKRNMDNIGHDAHFWGAAFGLLFTIVGDAIMGNDPSIVRHFIDTVSAGPR